MPVPSRLKIDEMNAAARKAKTVGPLWTGPDGPGKNGGVTQGLIGRYLSCPERFRVYALQGLRPREGFNPTPEFGNMWHEAERGLAERGREGAADRLTEYVSGLARKYPSDRNVIAEWAEKAAHLFDEYVKFWGPAVRNQKPLFQEMPFDVRYRLPSGREVRLRGKWDGGVLLGAGRSAGIWVDEHKTKSSIDVNLITRRLGFDLQTMTYLVALDSWLGAKCEEPDASDCWKHRVLGVRFNVVRRPLHKSVGSMLDKLGVDCRNGRSAEWFSRFNVQVSEADLTRFRRECLDPVLENLCDDWEWWERCFKVHGDTFRHSGRVDEFPHHRRRHFRMPYGVYNPLTEGGAGEIDEYLNTGSLAGLHRTDTLFPELPE